MDKFLKSNDTRYRLLRTIIQGVIGVIVSNLDIIIGTFSIPVEYKPLITAIVMAVLSPIMSELGGKESADELTDEEVEESHWVEMGDMEEDAK